MACRLDYGVAEGFSQEGDTVKPMAAAVAGAAISGVAMYAVGMRVPQADAFVETPALVQTLDGQYVAMARPANTTTLQPAATPVAQRRSAAPRRTVYRTVEPADDQVVVQEEAQPRRSWGKTGLIIGGAAASGAGVGGIVDGKKGALIGAAIGGGAASIYEATRRR
jgi:hypothetical protein